MPSASLRCTHSIRRQKGNNHSEGSAREGARQVAAYDMVGWSVPCSSECMTFYIDFTVYIIIIITA